MESQTETSSEKFIAAIKVLADALGQFKEALQECRKEGMTDNDIRDSILSTMPEEDRAEFIQQWPYFSMMLNLMG